MDLGLTITFQHSDRAYCAQEISYEHDIGRQWRPARRRLAGLHRRERIIPPNLEESRLSHTDPTKCFRGIDRTAKSRSSSISRMRPALLTRPCTACVGVTKSADNVGLATGKKVTIIPATGGDFRPGSTGEGNNQASGYLRQLLGWIGITDVEIMVANRTGGNGETMMQVFGAPVSLAGAA